MNNSNSKKAISVLSGGLDSTVATSLLADEYEIHAITFDYGQGVPRWKLNLQRPYVRN